MRVSFVRNHFCELNYCVPWWFWYIHLCSWYHFLYAFVCVFIFVYVKYASFNRKIFSYFFIFNIIQCFYIYYQLNVGITKKRENHRKIVRKKKAQIDYRIECGTKPSSNADNHIEFYHSVPLTSQSFLHVDSPLGVQQMLLFFSFFSVVIVICFFCFIVTFVDLYFFYLSFFIFSISLCQY